MAPIDLRFTKIDLQLLKLMYKGYSPWQICETMGLTEKRLSHRRRRIREKFNTTSDHHATFLAEVYGIV